MAYNGKKNADASRRRPESLGNAFENYLYCAMCFHWL